MKENSMINRVTSIELLRIVAMIMIMILHYFNQGRILDTITKGYNYYIIWLIEAICYISVNCYIFITGYFSWKTTFKWKRVVSFYLEIIFYSVVIAIVSFGCNIEPINIKNLVSLLPIVSRRNWFVTVYFACLFIIPLLNISIANISRRNYRTLLFILIIFFSLFPSLFCYIDQFNINSGYSILWYIVVYLSAAYIGKYDIRYSNIKCLLLISLVFILPISKIILEKLANSHTALANYSNTLYAYNSVPVFIASLGLFMFFLNIHIKESKFSQIIIMFGRSTFGVFYIHSYFLIRNHIWVFLGSLKYLDSIYFIPYSFAIIIICYFLFSLLDFARIKLFATKPFKILLVRVTEFLERKLCIDNY